MFTGKKLNCLVENLGSPDVHSPIIMCECSRLVVKDGINSND